MRPNANVYDLIVVGGGFAGLTAAASAAARDLKVAVIEAKPRSGAKVHTTGILVKEASQELDFPAALLRKIHGVRLYAPNLKHVDLTAPGYYFYATETAALLDWMALKAREAGVRIFNNTPFEDARIRDGFVEVAPAGIRGRFLIGADGPRSKVARAFGLSQNTRFLTGVEAEFPFIDPGNDHLHCFLDSRFAPGYLGWMVPGAGVRQIGLAFDVRRKPDLEGFLKKIEPITGVMGEPRNMRGGLIPCGGRLAHFANSHVLLVGDAAGIVSPLTGGGIHTALHYGRQAALSVCEYLQDGASHPGIEMAKAYPRFRMKRVMRLAMGLAMPNGVYNMMLGTGAFRALAQSIFFHARGGAAIRDMETPQQKRRRLHAA